METYRDMDDVQMVGNRYKFGARMERYIDNIHVACTQIY